MDFCARTVADGIAVYSSSAIISTKLVSDGPHPWREPIGGTMSIAPATSQPEYRTQPHNEEAEQALLGAMLVNNRAYDTAEP